MYFLSKPELHQRWINPGKLNNEKYNLGRHQNVYKNWFVFKKKPECEESPTRKKFWEKTLSESLNDGKMSDLNLDIYFNSK